MTKIAGHLSLSVKTISTYRSRLLEKLNLKSNAQLMHYAFKTGMVAVQYDPAFSSRLKVSSNSNKVTASNFSLVSG